ncbi:DUF6777 domain-containing protein [Yinghuangia seranimata]|uniref:DUF6777 domain-containing protein n=1 Tax=Yinghuangia seranimata TaxID=408067 RepID=UPI00248CC31A|nr:DUF6777 domain-containing protein [Yinghuangia seranimata]MDI2125163.1 hypothetical protein [Yinghuangia seranimata]
MLVGVVAIAVVVALVVGNSGGGGGNKQASGEVLLENAAADGPDPFTSSVASPVPTISAPPPSFASVPVPTAPGAPAPLRVENGGTVGLYGGTENNSTCDVAQMTRYLGENPSKAQAWVTGINTDSNLRWSGGTSVSTAQIPDYMRQLTPVVLRADTRVTNNGFVNGRPTPRQSILQTGSAVLVDTYGVPRARCKCGNPLAPPHAAAGKVTYQGTPWPGFSPTTVVVVNQSTTVINNFTLVNINTGTTYTQPPGPPPPTSAGPTQTETRTVTATATGAPPTAPPTAPSTAAPTSNAPSTSQGAAPPTGAAPTGPLSVPPTVSLGSGDIQVTLLWNGDSDIDLHVIDPAGEEIYFNHKTSASRGTLDHDDIPGCGSLPTTHVENVFWPSGAAPSGTYKAFVLNFGACPGKPPAAYELRIRVGGNVVSDTTGTLPQTNGAKSTPVTFTK